MAREWKVTRRKCRYEMLLDQLIVVHACDCWKLVGSLERKSHAHLAQADKPSTQAC